MALKQAPYDKNFPFDGEVKPRTQWKISNFVSITFTRDKWDKLWIGLFVGGLKAMEFEVSLVKIKVRRIVDKAKYKLLKIRLNKATNNSLADNFYFEYKVRTK